MKKMKIFLLIAFIGICYSHAKAQNPYDAIGKKTTMLTLTNGKYPEYIPYDSIQRIGSIVLNVKRMTVLSFLDRDSISIAPEVSSRWWAVDPLSAKYPSTSPYVFVENNPIFLVDHDGREVFIHGTDGAKTVAALQKVTSLKLSYNAETGQLTAMGKPNSKLDKALFGAIQDQKVNVNLRTTKANFYDSKDGTKNVAILVGGYEGSEIKKTNVNGKDVEKVETKQYFNYEQSEKVENAGLSNVGTDAAHEILESFYGGQDNPGGDYNSGFQNAHNKAMAADPNAKDLFPNNNTKTNSTGLTDGKGKQVDLIKNDAPKTKVEDEK